MMKTMIINKIIRIRTMAILMIFLKELLAGLDIHREKRAQKFLLLITLTHFLCLLPINILKYVCLSLNQSFHLTFYTYKHNYILIHMYIYFSYLISSYYLFLPIFYENIFRKITFPFILSEDTFT